jgi:asparagine synthetase B (glutamine-hydrolysing)
LYEAYGIQPFSMLGGMFAFSIHDKKTKNSHYQIFFGKTIITT